MEEGVSVFSLPNTVLARKCLTQSEFKFVLKYFGINSYMAHPESVLLGMLFDENRLVKAEAVNLILSAKKPGKKPRKFILPILKFNAEQYHKMIDWTKVKITIPAPVKHFSKEELRKCIAGNDLEIVHIPCHSTNNERYLCVSVVEFSIILPQVLEIHVLYLREFTLHVLENITIRSV